jgi:hypothetical protein
VAVNCWDAPLATDGFAGVTAMDCSVACVTVSTVDPVMAPEVAVMVEVPLLTAVAKPPGVIDATVVVDELHVAVPVRFCVVPSL